MFLLERACADTWLCSACRLTLYGLRDLVTTLLLAAGFLLNCAGPFFCLGSDWAWEYGFSAGPGEAQSLVINATYILQVMPPLVGLLSSARACIGSEC